LVYDGNVNYPSGENTITIPLQTVFPYTGGNLVLYANRPMDTVYFSSSDNFAAQTVGTNRARKLISDSTEYDPNAPSAAGTLSGTFPKTTFHMTPMGPNPIFSVNPPSKDFGTVLMNSTSNQTFTVTNAGGGTLTISNITIAGSPFFTLQSVPTMPVNLATAQTTTFVARYLPTAAGTHNATISITDNTTRVVRTVALTGTSINVNLNTLPYAQNFDAVTAPALPLDWNFIYQGTVTTGYVRTVTTTPQSTPNCVALYNSTDANANTMLIAPPLGTAFAPNTTRVKFYAKGIAGYTLSVGAMTNYLDAATYTQVQSIDLTNTWTQYVVSFAGYTGAGRHITFKHGLGGTSRTIYIDNVEIEVIPQNDLAVTALAGNVTPSNGSATTYTASVYNWGSVTQSTYSVKLYNSNNVQLATAAGTSVAAGATVQVPISWTPSAEGPVTIYAKVVLTGDQNTTNDQSPNLNITVMPSGMIVVTVGEGNLQEGIPVEMYYKNSLFETLYYPTEMGLFGNITALSFYNNFVTNLPNKPTKVWLGTTTQADLSAGWVPASQMTLVYNGNVNYPSGENTVIIPLQTPFTYTGGNLVMLVQRPMDTEYFSSSDNFAAQTVGTNRALKLYSDGTEYDPNAPTGGTLSGTFPKTTFHMTAIGPNPIYSVNPGSKNYGTVLLNSTSNQTFTVMNGGGGTLTISNITIAGSPFFTLQNVPTLPVNLATGQTMTFVGRYNPTAAGGPHTATITVTDNMARSGGREERTRLAHTIALTGNCIDTTINTLPYTQLFDAVTAPALPPDWGFLYQATTTAGYVRTVTTTPQSTPNCVALYNSTDANANVMLIAPPLGNSIAPNTTRVKFYAKGVAGYTLSVGMMTNYLDAATFAQVQSITLTSTWTQYVVTFAGYTGAGRYITFKHGLGGTSRTMYVDNVEIELTPQNDLAAISITGNQTPSNGMLSNYTVSVFNWGTNAQNTYTVKLFKQGDVEIGSVPGTNIAPGATVQVTVPWTPSAEGANTIYGKVVLAGDQNATNDQTSNLAVVVQPAGLLLITIGTGDLTEGIPLEFYYKNSLFETLYYPAELQNTIGTIYGLSFYNNFVTNLPAKPTKIWMGTTTNADLSAGWIPSTQLTLVYDGTINYPSGENTVYIPFQAPFLYLNGQNIVMMANRPMDTEYFSSSDNFLAQTVGTSRSINIYSDSTPYDPAAPPVPTATQITGKFPKTTFHIIPGGVGHLNGTILGVGGQPLAGVAVQFATGGYSTTTNAQGQYSIQNIIHETYQVSFSRYGYLTTTQTVVIPEDQTVVLNLTLQQMPVVNVTGTILASDTGAGLAGAGIHLTGYETYTVTTNTAGLFTIPAVYANNGYSYTIVCPGYQNAGGDITVGTTNYSMGNITLSEVAYAPRHLTAAINGTNTVVTVAWEAPDPTALDLSEGFEAATFPPAEWTRTVTNTGPANTAGIFPTWCSFGNISVDGTPVNPTEGFKQAGLWWSYDHQDEWLITPQFNCPPAAYLTFDTYATLGSANGDHYYVKVSSNNGTNWTVLWDASAQTAGSNNYSAPISIDLSLYEGLAIKIAWHAVDPPSNDGLWSPWFIDNVYIGNEVTSLQFATESMTTRSGSQRSDFRAPIPTTHASRAVEMGLARTPKSTPVLTNMRAIAPNPRSLTGYKVWRLVAGQEGTEASWTLITPQAVTVLTANDAGWATLANGTYRWAVKAVYTGNVLSVPVLSLPLVKEVVNGSVAGVCRNPQNQPVPGVTITAGAFTTTTTTSGAYNLSLPVGTYTVRAAKNGYLSVVTPNVIVNASAVTTLNFTMVPGVGNDDQLTPIVATELNGNYPNPFNPETTISYAIKDRTNVRLEIYNTKGQLIRTLVNQEQPTGRYDIVWNGKDNNNNAVSSGMYFYRMNAGSYASTRKMLLMQ